MATVNIPSTVDDPNYRYKMPRVKARIEGRGNGIKTNIVNMGDIARALKRPPEYPTKFCGCELGSASKFESAEGKAIVNGAHTELDLQQIIDKFVDRFVLCPQCRLPEIDLLVAKNRVQGVCNACGYKGDMDNGHKVGTYIVKNPPDGGSTVGGKGGKHGSGGSKKDRRAEKQAAATEDGSADSAADAAGGEPSGKSGKSKHKSSKSSSKDKDKSSGGSSGKHHHKHKHRSKSSAVDDEGVGAVTALSYDSPEIADVIKRLDDFFNRSMKPTAKDFFEEVRLLQVAQDFSPVMRVYVALHGLLGRVPAFEPNTLQPYVPYIRAVCDRSVSGEMILEALEAFVAAKWPAALDSPDQYARICHELYEADIVDEEDFVKRYSGVERSSAREVTKTPASSSSSDEGSKQVDGGNAEVVGEGSVEAATPVATADEERKELLTKAAAAASSFVRWLSEAESASDSSDDE